MSHDRLRCALWVAAIATAGLLLTTGRLSAAPIVTQVIDATGDGQGHGLEGPWGIGVDSMGNVFVAAVGSDAVLRRAPDGTITAVLDAGGDGLGHPMDLPNEVAIGPDDTVYVTAVGSTNVFARTAQGTIAQILDSSGDGAGNALEYPRDLTVDSAGNVFVSDLLTDRVFRIDPAGTVAVVLTADGDGAGHALDEPDALVTDPAGNLYVVGGRSHNVFRVSPSGAVTEVVNGLDYPTALALDPAGNLYVGDFGLGRVVRATPSGTTTVVASGVDPVALAVRSDGVVLIASSNGRRITGLRPSGPGCVVLDASGDGVHPFGFASRLALGDDGLVFASNVSLDGVFEIRDSCPAAPVVDAGGRWRVSVTYPPNDFFPPGPPETFLQDWLQSGFDLTVSDPDTGTVTFRGTIDDRESFTLWSVEATCILPGFCCPNQTIRGTVAPAGDGWLGTLTDNFFDIRGQCGNPILAPAAAVGTRCGNGVPDPGEVCDDGNWTDGDGCDEQCQVEPCYECAGSQCAPKILTCGGSARSSASTLRLRAGSARSLPRLHWTFSTGGRLRADALGNPATHTAYHLCVFDRSAGAPRVLASSTFAPGPSWRPRRGGFVYRKRSGEELKRIGLRVRTRVKVNTRVRSATLPSIPLPLPVLLTVQLRADDAECFEAKFSSAGVVENDADGFRAVSDPQTAR